MTTSILDKVAAAKKSVPSISPSEAAALHRRDDVLFVDVRDAEEVAATGMIDGALNISRGMLEFRADAATPYHNPAMATHKTVVLYCASGGRSALCGQALLEMGYSDVRNLGAFKDWSEQGFPVSGS